jgi:putative membrane protein
VQSDVRTADALANERTFLAYVRTALAFVAFGFVIAKFSLFAREFAVLVRIHPAHENVSTGFGTAMAIAGVAIALLGAFRYAATDRALKQGRIKPMSIVTGYAIAGLVAAIGAVVAMALLAYR